MKKNNNKGFTLAELLIVVAIIAVLVAVAIPIFNTQLEKAREATDIANARDFYAEIAVGLVDGTLTKSGDTMKVTGNLTATPTYDANGVLTSVSVAGVTVNQKNYNNWTTTDFEIAGVKKANVTAPASASATTITYTFTDGNLVTAIAWSAAS